MSTDALPVAPAIGTERPAIRYAGIGDEGGRSIEAQLGSLGCLGWRAIELRTIDDLPIAALDDRSFAALSTSLCQAGTDVVCVASQIGSWSRPITGDFDLDIAELDVLAGRCDTLGTRLVRVMSYLNDGLDDLEWGRRATLRLRELAGRAEQAGLSLVHENCTGWAAIDPHRMLDLLAGVDSPAFGLLFDTGNGVEYGYEAHAVLELVVDHVRHVHVKDVSGTPEHPVYAPPGAGGARVADCLRLLLAAGYTGAWTIEPHLALRPHDPGARGLDGGERGADGRRAGFVACGLALERLVRDDVLADGSPWTPAPGGIVRGSPT